MRLRTAVLAIPAASVLLVLGFAAPALADDSVDVKLDALNDSPGEPSSPSRQAGLNSG